MKYLLGLQVKRFNPEDPPDSSVLSLHQAVPTPKDEQLLALLGKKDEDPNPSPVVVLADPIAQNLSLIKNHEIPPLADIALKRVFDTEIFDEVRPEGNFDPKLTDGSNGKPLEPRQPAEWQAVSREVAIRSFGDPFPAMRVVPTPKPVLERSERAAEPISIMEPLSIRLQDQGEKLKTEDEMKTLSGKSSLSFVIEHAGSARNTETWAETEPDKVRLTRPTDLLKTVQTLSHQGGGKMVVSLYPPDLGQVEVSVTTRGNRVEIKMTPENQAAKSIIESGLTDLKHAMQAQDLVVSKLEVNFAKPGAFEGGISWLSADAHSQRFDGFREPQREPQSQRGKTTRIEPISTALMDGRAFPSGRLDVRI